MSIVDTTLWPVLVYFFRIVPYSRDGGHAHPRVRIEVDPLPEGLLQKALALTMPCVKCGELMHPIRARKPPGNQRGKASGLYYAATCPLSTNIGCSRGKAAKDEYTKVKLLLRPDLKEEKP